MAFLNKIILNYPRIQSLNFERKISTTSVCLTRTAWSLNRKKMNIPTCFVPKYLLNGSLRAGQGGAGRNITGHITIRHKGGRRKQNYRMIDFLRVPYEKKAEKQDLSMYKDEIVGLSFDPCRTAMIALVAGNSSDRYKLIIAAEGMKIGNVIRSSRGEPPSDATFFPGDTFLLKYFPKLSKVYNIENYPGNGAKIARSGDAYMTILEHIITDKKHLVKLVKDGRKITLNGNCLASYGVAMSNIVKNLMIGKAGRARRLNVRAGGRKGINRLRKTREKGRKNLRTHIMR